MEKTSNFNKHNSSNPIQKALIENFYKTFIRLIKNLKLKSILDVGCGEGFTLERLKKEKIGERLLGVDNNPDAVMLGTKTHPGITLQKEDIYNLPFKGNSFDLVICTEVLEHLENPSKALDEIVRVSNRYIVLSVPNEPLFRLANFFRGKNLARLGNDQGHVNHWSAWSFTDFVLEKKAKILTKKTPFPWTILLMEKNHYDDEK